MSDENCAHMRVSWMTEDSGGNWLPRWECNACGTAFLPRPIVEGDVAGMRADLARERSAREAAEAGAAGLGAALKGYLLRHGSDARSGTGGWAERCECDLCQLAREALRDPTGRDLLERLAEAERENEALKRAHIEDHARLLARALEAEEALAASRKLARTMAVNSCQPECSHEGCIQKDRDAYWQARITVEKEGK